MDQEIRDCQKCKEFVAEGKEELLKILQKIDSLRKEEISNETKHPEDFVLFCKFLMFCCPVVPLPIGGNLAKVIQNAIEKSGSKENILIFCFPTPEQRNCWNVISNFCISLWIRKNTVHDSKGN